MKDSAKIIKTKPVGSISYSLSHWPQSNIYVIHQDDRSKDGTGTGHLSLEVASFNNEKEAVEYFDNI